MKTILIILIILFSCTKEQLPDCDKAILLSDKYTRDSVYIRTDTLWRENICGEDLKRVRETKDFWTLDCNSMLIEHWRYELLSQLSVGK